MPLARRLAVTTAPGLGVTTAVLLAVTAALGLAACGSESPTRSGDTAPESAAQNRYVTSAVCAQCHAEEFAAWRGSHHDLAMQPATADTVLGDFDDARFPRFPVVTRFSQRDGRYYVETDGADGEPGEYEVLYTFGVEPLQQYLIALPGGRLQNLPIAWDTKRERWFDLYPSERLDPGDAFHWTGRYQRWNAMCADCHSTALERGYDADTDTYDTTWAEIDVGCEACHGPGANHASWARGLAPGATPPAGASALAVALSGRDSRYEVELCAPCHARRHPVSAAPVTGEPLLDHYAPAWLREGLYHADGQIHDEVYVYGSFVQSRMYAQGVRCSDCHEPHGLGLRAEGNALCTRCHSEAGETRFPSLRLAAYDTPDHHFHPQGSNGAQCVACHMPETTYMVIDPRRDHGLRVPRPDLSVELGTPNPCTGCHADRNEAWAAQTLTDWYGTQRTDAPHFAEALAGGRAVAPEAEALLVGLAADSLQSAIVRATAVDLLRGYGVSALGAIAAATRDPDPLVRMAAVSGLDPLPPPARVAALAPLLEDRVRAVRVEAARALASVPESAFDARQSSALEAALVEYVAAQETQADLPAGRFNLGVLHVARGDAVAAETAFRAAVEMDPAFLPARANLSQLYAATARPEAAVRVLREGIARTPDEGELHYSLGLVLAERGDLPAAERALGEAARLLPHRARVQYNHGLALQGGGRPQQAETALRAAAALEPGNADFVRALAVLYFQQERWEDARVQAERLVLLSPGAPGPMQMLQQFRARALRAGVPPETTR